MTIGRAARCGIACLLAAGAAGAAERRDTDGTNTPASDGRGTFHLTFENDGAAGTDRNYTNGLEVGWLSAPLERRSDWRFGLNIGQQIFTPNNTDAVEYVPGERPYAGWLYAGFALVVDDGKRLDTWLLNLGVVGPSAGGEDVQNGFHRRTGSDLSYGWDNQLRDEAGAQLVFERRWRGLLQTPRGALGVDLSPHVGASLGNIATYANAGLTLRFGNDLRNDYGVPRIRPALPGAAFFEPDDGFAWYLFAGVDGRAVAQNIFLDGNTGVDSSPSVPKETFVADAQAGAALIFRRVRLTYTYVYRTREFKGQPGPDRFGAISISARF